MWLPRGRLVRRKELELGFESQQASTRRRFTASRVKAAPQLSWLK